MTRVPVLLGAIACTGCSYGVSFADCELTCQGPEECPSDFSCMDGMCRAAGAMGACTQPGSVTLSQTADDKVDRNLVFACTNGDGTTAATSWYRVFSLAEAEVTTPFHVDHATLGISFTLGQPTVFAKLYTYTGGLIGNTLDLAKATQVQAASAVIPATQITELVDIQFPATVIPAGTDVLLEMRLPDRNGTGEQVNIGSTDAGQSHQAYFLAPLCGINVPTGTTTAGHPDAHFVLTLTGTR